MASKHSGNIDEPIAEINVVPLVDVMLVVLIIFMVTAPMFLKPSINVNLPKAASGEETTASKLNITLTVTGDILLNGKTSTLEEIKTYSQDNVEKNPELQAIIAADKDVAHGKVITVIDTVKLAGIKKFAISIDRNKQD